MKKQSKQKANKLHLFLRLPNSVTFVKYMKEWRGFGKSPRVEVVECSAMNNLQRTLLKYT